MAQQFDNALHVMEVQGGSFVKSLAACYYAADPTNRPKLRATFASYFNEYEARFRSISGLPPVAPEAPAGAAQLPSLSDATLDAIVVAVRSVMGGMSGDSNLAAWAALSQPSQQKGA